MVSSINILWLFIRAEAPLGRVLNCCGGGGCGNEDLLGTLHFEYCHPYLRHTEIDGSLVNAIESRFILIKNTE